MSEWISVEDRLPTDHDRPCAVVLNGKSRRCCGFMQAWPEMRDGDEVIPPQPAEWWLDCEGINTVSEGVTFWLSVPPEPKP